MDFDFSELDPEIEQLNFQKRYQQLLKIMYDESLPYPFENHLFVMERSAKRDLALDADIKSFRKQSALINLKVVEALRKDYALFKLISQ